MRISRLDAEDPEGKKRRHFEISIDSPISILNCRATQANLALPEYSDLSTAVQNQQQVCGCPNAAMSSSSPTPPSSSANIVENGNISLPASAENVFPNLARPPQAHLSTNAASGVQRPIHMLRNPSFNPPAFDAEEPPPPIATPPPLYDNVIGTPSHDGLADYFARYVLGPIVFKVSILTQMSDWANMKMTIQMMMTTMISKELLVAVVLMLQIHELLVAGLLEVWILTEISCSLKPL
jgi:hypothetical protein